MCIIARLSPSQLYYHCPSHPPQPEPTRKSIKNVNDDLVRFEMVHQMRDLSKINNLELHLLEKDLILKLKQNQKTTELAI